MSNMQIFESPEWGPVRTVELDGAPWLVGKDVAQALGYSDTSDALKRHVDPEDKLTRRFTDSGQNREMYIINESGLYSYTKQYLSERLGLSSDGLKRKLMGQTDFKLGEVALLAKLLNLSDHDLLRIFFWKVHVDFGIYTGGET